MERPLSVRLLPLCAATVVGAAAGYVSIGWFNLKHPNVFDPGTPDMSGAVAVLFGMGETAVLITAAVTGAVVCATAAARVYAGSNRWTALLLNASVLGVLVGALPVWAALTSDAEPTEAADPVSPSPVVHLPAWYEVVSSCLPFVTIAGFLGCLVALLVPTTRRYLEEFPN
jgi:hypothetical protein